jgi:hypothetical protein
MKCSISELEGGQKPQSKLTHLSLKRGKCRRTIVDPFVSKQQARQENTKTSKNQKTVKNLNLLMKYFYPFLRPLSTLTPK